MFLGLVVSWCFVVAGWVFGCCFDLTSMGLLFEMCVVFCVVGLGC